MADRPRTIPGWIDLLNLRVRRLELARSQHVGRWVLEERRADGALVARNISTGTVIELGLP